MACGCGVIGTNVTGIREIIDHEKNGLLVEETVEDLRNAIIVCGQMTISARIWVLMLVKQ